MKNIITSKIHVSVRRASNAGIYVFMLIAMLLLIMRSASAIENQKKIMKTVGGVLQVEGNMPGQRLLINNDPVTYISGNNKVEIADDIIVLQEKYQIKDNDVIMIYTTCAGSSCSYSSVYFITINSKGKFIVSGPIEADEDGLEKENIKLVDDGLSISTKIFISPRNSKTERWMLVDGKLERSK